MGNAKSLLQGLTEYKREYIPVINTGMENFVPTDCKDPFTPGEMKDSKKRFKLRLEEKKSLVADMAKSNLNKKQMKKLVQNVIKESEKEVGITA